MEFKDLQQTADSLIMFTDYGKKIIQTYQNASDVLVNSMVYAISNIVDGFIFIIQTLLTYDDPIQKTVSYL